jgi:hypothetical protein
MTLGTKLGPQEIVTPTKELQKPLERWQKALGGVLERPPQERHAYLD